LVQIPLAAEWREVLDMAGIATHDMLQPVAFIEHETTDTQAWVYWNRRERVACVAFRGTEHNKWRDILTDLHLVPTPLDPGRAATAPRKAGERGAAGPGAWRPGLLHECLRAAAQNLGAGCTSLYNVDQAAAFACTSWYAMEHSACRST
jgi:hypothetical protein